MKPTNPKGTSSCGARLLCNPEAPQAGLCSLCQSVNNVSVVGYRRGFGVKSYKQCFLFPVALRVLKVSRLHLFTRNWLEAILLLPSRRHRRRTWRWLISRRTEGWGIPHGFAGRSWRRGIWSGVGISPRRVSIRGMSSRRMMRCNVLCERTWGRGVHNVTTEWKWATTDERRHGTVFSA